MDLPGRDPEALLVEALPVVDEVVRFVCRRGHSRPEEAEDFAGWVRLRLVENDYAILRQYAGRSSLKSYLAVVVQRLFIDARRQHLGVWRPSAEARRLGPLAVRLDTLLHRDRMPLDQAVSHLLDNERAAASEAELRALAARLPPRQRRRFEGEEALANLAVPAEAAVEQPAFAGQRGRRAAAVQRLLHEAREALPSQDALLLRLRYEESLPVARIADLLGLAAKPLYRRIERVLGTLRAALERRGVSAEQVGELVDAEPLDDEAPGGRPGGPSLNGEARS